MKLFIDSSQKTFVAATIEKNILKFKSEIETKYKVEEIISFFNKVPDFDQIKEIYINLGPGSFVGSRVALLYVRTMAQINKDIKIFATNTFELLSKQLNKKGMKKVYIAATKNKSYCLTSNKIEIVEKSKKEVEIDYNKILNYFYEYESCFSETNLKQLKPIYAAEPQIGKVGI